MSRKASTNATRALRGLEVRLLGISRELGETAARVCASRSPPSRRRLSFQPLAPGGPPFRRRLRFSPLAQEADRLVVTNWDSNPGLVTLGDVELELEPGQSATLWINRAAPLPHTEPLYEEPSQRSPGFAFADSGPLISP